MSELDRIKLKEDLRLIRELSPENSQSTQQRLLYLYDDLISRLAAGSKAIEENKELKEKLEFWQKNRGVQSLIKLEAENKELKKQVETLQNLSGTSTNTKPIQEEVIT